MSKMEIQHAFRISNLLSCSGKCSTIKGKILLKHPEVKGILTMYSGNNEDPSSEFCSLLFL